MYDDTTMIMYDFDRIKNKQFEFVNLDNYEERRSLDLRIMDMQDTIRSFQSMFGGDIILMETYVLDQSGNRVLIRDQPIVLEVPYYLTAQEIKYVKSCDDGLIIVM